MNRMNERKKKISDYNRQKFKDKINQIFSANKRRKLDRNWNEKRIEVKKIKKIKNELKTK